jgi:flagellar protein FliS
VDNPYSSYRKTQIETATSGQLVVLLYQGAVRFLSLALTALEEGNIEMAHKSLVKAQDIVLELRATLNPEAGDIAQKLDALYDYMLRRLVEANFRKEGGPVREVLAYLQELLPAWEAAARAQDVADGRVMLEVAVR